MPIRVLASLLAMLAALGGTAEAHQYKVGDMLVVHPWMAATDATATEVAAFITLKNQGPAEDRLLSVYLPEARSFSFAASENGDPQEGDKAAKSLDVAPGGKIKLKPGTGYILLGIKGPVPEGRMLTGTLTFEKAGKVDVGFYVQDAAAQGATCAANPDGE